MGVKYMNNNQVPQNTDKGLKNILLGTQMQKNTIAIMPKINATISLLLINYPFNMPNGIFIIILYIN